MYNGLTNAPATFQHLNEMSFEFIGFKHLSYLDDVIVFGKIFQKIYDNLQALLYILALQFEIEIKEMTFGPM